MLTKREQAIAGFGHESGKNGDTLEQMVEKLINVESRGIFSKEVMDSFCNPTQKPKLT